MLKIIVAVSENGIIGSDGNIPWKLPDDMKWFKEQTGNNPVVMGRKTYESLPKRFRPLPGRQNIIITRDEGYCYFAPTCTFLSWEEVVTLAETKDLFVIGGGEIYKLALPLAAEIYLTRVEVILAGDTFFPKWNKEEWELVSCQFHFQDARHEHRFSWQVWKRK